MVSGTVASAHNGALEALDPVSEFKAKHKKMVEDAIAILRQYTAQDVNIFSSPKAAEVSSIARHFLTADNMLLEQYHGGILYELTQVVYGAETLIKKGGVDPEYVIASLEDGLEASIMTTGRCRTLTTLVKEIQK